MAVEGLGSNSKGVAFLVSGGVVLEAIAAACSSPQTTELNAEARAETLMKWVKIGVGLGAGLVIVAAMFDPANSVAMLTGGILTAGIMWALYAHARKAGLASNQPGTESY